MIHLYLKLFIAMLSDYIDKINYLVLYLGNIKTTVVAERACTVRYCLPRAPHGGDTTKLLHAKGLAVPSSPYIVFGCGICNVPNITGMITLIRISMVRIVYRI